LRFLVENKTLKKSVLKFIESVNGFAAFRWLNRRRALVLTYHRFSETEHPGRVSRQQLQKHLEFLTANYRVLPLWEIVDCLAKNKSLPENAAAITVDDGYADFYDIAFPVLKSFRAPATLFIITNFLDRKSWLWTDKARYLVENTEIESFTADFGGQKFDSQVNRATAAKINEWLKKLPDEEKEARLGDLQKIFAVDLPELPPENFAAIDWRQAREMGESGVGIESHTVSHPILTNVSDERLQFELRQSKARLQEVLGRAGELFCYPNGGFDRRVKTAAKSAGYRAAVTTNLGFNDAASADLFELRRVDAMPEEIDFLQYTSGFENVKNRVRSFASK
jgi:peptidoglycan/xylan/chitin deacetylase (PgdA/CDA1 family)